MANADFMTSHLPTFWKFPTEIYGRIFEQLPATDVSRMCRLSSTAQGEAERLLYQRIHLGILSIERTIRFFETISETSRVARLVKDLNMPVSGWHSSIMDLLTKSIPRLVGLKFLTMEYLPIMALPLVPPLFHVLESSPFRLERLTLEKFGFHDVSAFLLAQPTIREWRHIDRPDSKTPVLNTPFRDDFLPCLEAVDVDSELLLSFASSRPISRIRITLSDISDVDRDVSTIDSLGKYRGTLRTVILKRTFSGYHFPLVDHVHRRACDLLSRLALVLPNLTVLAFQDDWMTADHPTHPDQVESLSEFLHALSKLSGLEVFLLYGHYACHPSSLWWTIWDNNWTTVDRVHIFVKACPSLRLVLTPVSRDEWDAVAYERDADQQMKLVPLDWMDNYFPSVLFSLDCHNTTLRTMLQHWLHP